MALAKELIGQYYNSLNQKDNKWQGLYSEDAVFSDASQTLNALGKTEVIQSFVPFLKGVGAVKLKQMIAEGEDVCAIVHYEYVNPKGNKMSQEVAEVWKVRSEKLAELTIFFDLTAYRAFMKG
jgi:ketosteroid isomerase-like protein